VSVIKAGIGQKIGKNSTDKWEGKEIFLGNLFPTNKKNVSYKVGFF